MKDLSHNINFVRDNLLETDVLLQLSEEAAELSQAASKRVRVILGNNPTPVTAPESEQNLLEEYADVLLCMLVLYSHTKDNEINNVIVPKLQRWVDRIKSETCTVTQVMQQECDNELNTIYDGVRVNPGYVVYGISDGRKFIVKNILDNNKDYSLSVQDAYTNEIKEVKPEWMVSSCPNMFVSDKHGKDTSIGDTKYIRNTRVTVIAIDEENNYVTCLNSDNKEFSEIKPHELTDENEDSEEQAIDDYVKYLDFPNMYFNNLCKTFPSIEELRSKYKDFSFSPALILHKIYLCEDICNRLTDSADK